jgi:hypothetical protein
MPDGYTNNEVVKSGAKRVYMGKFNLVPIVKPSGRDKLDSSDGRLCNKTILRFASDT